MEESARAATAEDELYHFISYVPVGGYLYELDGLKEGPINLGAVRGDAWLAAAAPAIQERIERYAASEIRFNLMAIIRSREDELSERSALCAARKAALLAAGGAEAAAGAAACDAELAELAVRLEAAREQAAGWREENVRRKHPYIPFIFNFLRVLAESGKLKPVIEKAKALAEAARAG